MGNYNRVRAAFVAENKMGGDSAGMEARGKHVVFFMTTNKTMASGNINNNFYTRFFQQELKVEEHQQLLEEELGI